ncbi:alkene reductase [Amycolatopsis sp. WQ 127309]|uniref:alkene reductase n=1 Tax=Amycolatopsis sp. WQ 127309 TaxID=2932773 RepID=UPI001FF5B214|nr:alkene reductase [Amycolatopsis sp. WQ 127309]UOZ03455.1 alkene reductase [Amycolatopsis sp. WQ 127309]
MNPAFEPLPLGPSLLANRIGMSPMTRGRCFGPGSTPTDWTTAYYAQRASAGFIVTEGMQPSPGGQGAPGTPGMHSAEQVTAWRPVTEAVHRRGGVIFAQLMHSGRVSHPDVLPEGLRPVGPSAIAVAGELFTGRGMKEFVAPDELSEAGITTAIADYAAAARNAISAGFDGVEIHGANGYLPHQFLALSANRRTDRWGGAPENRMRFMVTLVEAVSAAIGAERVGLRLSPGVTNNSIHEPDRETTYPLLVDRIERTGLAYLHVFEGPDRSLTWEMRKRWPGVFVLNPHTPDRRTAPGDLSLLDDGLADVITFGAMFIGNPDLPERIAAGGPYTEPDPATFYGGDERGYIDYPALIRSGEAS